MDCSPPGSCLQDSPGKNNGVGCHFLLQGIFLIQELNPRLLNLLYRQAGSLPLPSEFIPSWWEPGQLQSMRSQESDMTGHLSMRATEENLGKSLHSWRPQCSYHMGENFSILLASSLERVSKDPGAGLHRCPFPPPNTPGSVLDSPLLTLVSPDQVASISHLGSLQPPCPPLQSTLGPEGSCTA